MPALPFDLQTLLEPIGDEAPSGLDPVYEAPFAALEQAGLGKPERQYGDKVYPAEPPDWAAVFEQSLALAASTRDLRIGVWLMRSATHVHGLRGAVAGLMLLAGLLDRFWPSVHPQLDTDDAEAATMRLNALMPLATPAAVPADLRAAALGSLRGSLTLRELELGLGQAEALPGEAQPTEAGVRQALAAVQAREPDLPELAASAVAACDRIGSLLEQQVGMAEATDLTPLRRLLQTLRVAVSASSAEGAEDETGASGTHAGADGRPATARSGGSGIQSRDDAARELERVCVWLERHEPAHPAPLLIRRAQRLLNMSFMEIIRDLAPDGLAQVENLAGPEAPA